LTLLSPTFDQGVGTHVVLRQIVAEVLRVPLEQARVVIGDTDIAPMDGGVGGARVTNVAGNATYKAATELLERLVAVAADVFECPPEEVTTEGGDFWPREDPRRRVTLRELVARVGGGEPLIVSVTVNMPADETISCFAAQIAEVEADPETGQFRILRFITAHDVGTILNPITHQGQIDGGVVQGIGMATMEDLAIEDGRVLTLHLGDYKLPTIADVPPLETVLVRANVGPAPYSGKAIGEMANSTAPAAIANAVAAAVGARIMELPVTAEKVYFELRALQG
ncbi:MAG: molybdopterin-dependent oxidoreductase, partial [Chloroflexi bacterium]|nr:molybdopterin-dependent oxidoreductase [Chloroflexota bacterium]